MNSSSLKRASAAAAWTIIAAAATVHVGCKQEDPAPVAAATPDAGATQDASSEAAVTAPDGSVTASATAQVAAGKFFTCAILQGGRVKCWGVDSVGQIGSARGFGTDVLDPKTVSAIDLDGSKAVALALGAEHACALLDDGGVKCWGNNNSGQLGVGGSISAAGFSPGSMGAQLPKVELGGKAVALTAGLVHNCALLDDGTAKCWGNNNRGQLGIASSDNYFEPALAINAGKKITRIVAGGYHTCAIFEDGTLKCWGENVTGQLGYGDINQRCATPGQTVASLPAVDVGGKVINVALGNLHTCAVLEGGKVKCWGDNSDGQLGLGDTTTRGIKPNQMGANLPNVELDGVAKVLTLGNETACALLEGDKVKCWGNNSRGAVGLGEPDGRGYLPNQMGANLPALGLPPTAQISAVEDHVCATSIAGEVRCWGENSNGELGYGDKKRRGLVSSALPRVVLE